MNLYRRAGSRISTKGWLSEEVLTFRELNGSCFRWRTDGYVDVALGKRSTFVET